MSPRTLGTSIRISLGNTSAIGNKPTSKSAQVKQVAQPIAQAKATSLAAQSTSNIVTSAATLSSTAIIKMPSAPSFLKTPDATARTRGAHWANDTATAFINPWDSAKGKVFAIKHILTSQPDIKNPSKFIHTVIPKFPSNSSSKLRATWLGHACVLVTFPSETGIGITVLFDPVFSDGCGPTSYLGPKRFTQPPCDIADLPHVDAIVISHNHYDHQDIPTIQHIFAHQTTQPLLFLPLNTLQSLRTARLPLDRIVEMDWWEESTIDVPGKGIATLTCTPSQHGSGRGIFDQGRALWASWAVKSGESSVWFAGDTGYCAVHDDSHTIDPSLPTNPAFKEIGTKLGPFTGSFIPIGAYSPRSHLSVIHNAPIDAVRMFKDVNAKKGFAIHWGTWNLSLESVSEPPRLLDIARKEVGLPEEDFGVVDIGEMIEWEV